MTVHLLCTEVSIENEGLQFEEVGDASYQISYLKLDDDRLVKVYLCVPYSIFES